MKKLVFKLDYAGRILSGEKVTTIRLRTNVREGDLVEVYVGHARVGRAVIKKVIRKRLSELSDEELRKDGFSSREQLLRELSKIYGRKVIESNPEVYVIEFELVD